MHTYKETHNYMNEKSTYLDIFGNQYACLESIPYVIKCSVTFWTDKTQFDFIIMY